MSIFKVTIQILFAYVKRGDHIKKCIFKKKKNYIRKKKIIKYVDRHTTNVPFSEL